MELTDLDTIKYFTQKCFDTCIDSFKHKLLTPHEQECFRTCLKNVRGMHLEMVNGQQLYAAQQAQAQEQNGKLSV